MAITEAQLQAWAHQGAIATAKATHESIRTALEDADSEISDKDFEVYLQGSYRNTTNVRGDSDVDVVVQLNSSFYSDLSDLTADAQIRQSRAFVPAIYDYAQFRNDVLQVLRARYGRDSVEDGNKAIKVQPGPSRLSADVLPSVQYRRYLRFESVSDQSYIEGLTFWARHEGRQIINYPKEHYQNGVAKHNATNDWYKPTVRVFKNARNYLETAEILPKHIAPSYFLECLLFNVPVDCFGGNYVCAGRRITRWLRSAKLEEFICQNGQQWLFGAAPEQWSVASAKATIVALDRLWSA